MGFLHNTKIKKWLSEILGQNYMNSGVVLSSDTVIPTVEVSPRIDIFRSVTTTDTIYTTPSDRDFYLTNVAMTVANNTSLATNTVTFVDENGVTRTVYLHSTFTVGTAESTGTAASISITFPFRGILLARGSAISYSMAAADLGSGMIAGYLGDDRS